MEKSGKGSDTNMGGIGMGGSMRTGSAKDKKPLEGATSKFFVGTEVRTKKQDEMRVKWLPSILGLIHGAS